LRKVYKRIRPRILVYEKPDPIILEEIESMFVHQSDGEWKSIEDIESLYLVEGAEW